MPWTVYILRCADGTLYTGITNDLMKRLRSHTSGKGAKYTRGRAPLSLLYTEPHRTQGSALKRELVIKGMDRIEKMGLILG